MHTTPYEVDIIIPIFYVWKLRPRVKLKMAELKFKIRCLTPKSKIFLYTLLFKKNFHLKKKQIEILRDHRKEHADRT